MKRLSKILCNKSNTLKLLVKVGAYMNSRIPFIPKVFFFYREKQTSAQDKEVLYKKK